SALLGIVHVGKPTVYAVEVIRKAKNLSAVKRFRLQWCGFWARQKMAWSQKTRKEHAALNGGRKKACPRSGIALYGDVVLHALAGKLVFGWLKLGNPVLRNSGDKPQMTRCLL